MGTKPSKKQAKSSRPNFDISLVIPCYNETARLDKLFAAVNQFVKGWPNGVEIIIVDDGSTDGTSDAIKAREDFSDLHRKGIAQVLTLKQNMGKGGALGEGVAVASGDYILTLDADMSTHPRDILEWWRKAPEAFQKDRILIGSRELKESDVQCSKSRRFVGRIFNAIVHFFTPLHNTDTQCGFKLYPRQQGKTLFAELKVKGWAHDVELLYRAHQMGLHIQEMPVAWHEEEGSKVSVARDSIRMLLQVIQISFMLKWKYYVKDAVDALRKKPITSTHTGGGHPIFRLLFIGSLLLLLIFMPQLSRDYGISGDERVQYYYGEHLLDYFTSVGQDTVAQNCCPESSMNDLHFYGGFFDLVSSAVHHTFNEKGNPFDTRHFVNALFGFIAILFTGLLARFLGGYRAGFIAVVLLVLIPRFFGHSMNNPKDIPFAAAYMITLFYIFKSLKYLPKPRVKDLVGLAVGIALAISIRIGGLLLIAYGGLFVLLTILANKGLRKNLMPDLPKYLKWGIPTLVIGYLGGLLFWPYAHLGILSKPLEALDFMTHSVTPLNVLFGGEYIRNMDVPWNYLPWWILNTVPLVSLLGAALGMVMWLFIKRFRSLNYGLLLFAAVFPIVYIIYQSSALHDGMRHILFVLPILAIVAALGWNNAIRYFSKSKLNWLPALSLITLLVLPAQWSISNHPHQVVYFNEIAGGPKGVAGEYELDYWYNSIKPAVRKMIKRDNLKSAIDTIHVVSNASFPVRHYLEQSGVPAKITYAKYNKEDDWIPSSRSSDRSNVRFRNWDYAVFVSRYMETQEFEKHWPPAGTWLTENVGGVPLSIVLKHHSHEDISGYRAYQQQDWVTASSAFDTYHAQTNGSGLTRYYSGVAKMNAGNIAQAIRDLNKSLELRPSGAEPNIFPILAQAYIQNGNLEQALSFTEQSINRQSQQVMAYEQSFQDGQIKQQDYYDYANLLGTISELYRSQVVIYNQQGNSQAAQNARQLQQQYGQAYQQVIQQLQ